jgi:hypothetical protein
VALLDEVVSWWWCYIECGALHCTPAEVDDQIRVALPLILRQRPIVSRLGGAKVVVAHISSAEGLSGRG